jgi:hypothetical protein
MLNFPDTPTSGQNFQNWQWDGVKWVPIALAPPAPASGSKVLINRVDVIATVASVDFFSGFDGTYDELELHVFDVQTSADAQPWLRFSADGSTFSAGASDYTYSWAQVNSAATQSLGGASGAALVMGASWGSTATFPNYHIARIRRGGGVGNARAAVLHQNAIMNSTSYFSCSGGGQWAMTPLGQLPLGMRFLLSASATIARGSFILYGIKK